MFLEKNTNKKIEFSWEFGKHDDGKDEKNKDFEPPSSKISKYKAWIITGIIAFVILTFPFSNSAAVPQTNWNDFINRILPSGQVKYTI